MPDMSTEQSGAPTAQGTVPQSEILTSEDIRALIGQCSEAPTGVRNRSLILVMCQEGLRLSEALALSPDHVNLYNSKITIEGSRVLSLDWSTRDQLFRWMELRKKLGLDSADVLFCTLKGGVLSPAYVRQLLPRLAEQAGVRKRVHANGLRDAYAAELLATGLSKEVIRTRLGYNSRRSLIRYVRQLSGGWQS